MKENSKPDRIDEIYAQITAQESLRREKYMLTISGSVLVLFFILISSFILNQEPKPLDIRQEQNKHLEESIAGGSVETSDFVEEQPIEELNFIQDDLKEPNEATENDQSILLEISGEQLTVNELEFHILNFDPNFVYRVDFGNGVGERVDETFSYSYDKAGFFELKITAYGKNNSKLKYKRTLDIKSFEQV